MGKKGKLYFIVFINLLAWGYVGYKVYSALQGDDDIEVGHESVTIKKIDETVKEKKAFLALNYPDPFLKNGIFSNAANRPVKSFSGTGSSKPKLNNNTLPKLPVIVDVKPAVDIKYLGLLKNNDKGTQTAMLTINGKSVFVKQNDVIEGFNVLEISGTNLTLKKGKEIIMISK